MQGPNSLQGPQKDKGLIYRAGLSRGPKGQRERHCRVSVDKASREQPCNDSLPASLKGWHSRAQVENKQMCTATWEQ
jgi:hypothetical protein